jgi:hypothetical protein
VAGTLNPSHPSSAPMVKVPEDIRERLHRVSALERQEAAATVRSELALALAHLERAMDAADTLGLAGEFDLYVVRLSYLHSRFVRGIPDGERRGVPLCTKYSW